MRLKKPIKNKVENLTFRCTKDERMQIRRKAALYCEGNISEWILYAALNFIPDKEDFEDEKPPASRGKK